MYKNKYTKPLNEILDVALKKEASGRKECEVVTVNKINQRYYRRDQSTLPITENQMSTVQQLHIPN